MKTHTKKLSRNCNTDSSVHFGTKGVYKRQYVKDHIEVKEIDGKNVNTKLNFKRLYILNNNYEFESAQMAIPSSLSLEKFDLKLCPIMEN